MMQSGNQVGTGRNTIEPLFDTVDLNAAGISASAYIKLTDYDHVSLWIHFGVITTGASAAITVVGSDDSNGTHTVALTPLRWRKKVGKAAWGAMASKATSLTVVAGGDIVPVTDAGAYALIEIDAAEILALSSTYDLQYVRLAISNPGSVSVLASGEAIFSKGTLMTEPPLVQAV